MTHEENGDPARDENVKAAARKQRPSTEIGRMRARRRTHNPQQTADHKRESDGQLLSGGARTGGANSTKRGGSPTTARSGRFIRSSIPGGGGAESNTPRFSLTARTRNANVLSNTTVSADRSDRSPGPSDYNTQVNSCVKEIF